MLNEYVDEYVNVSINKQTTNLERTEKTPMAGSFVDQ